MGSVLLGLLGVAFAVIILAIVLLLVLLIGYGVLALLVGEHRADEMIAEFQDHMYERLRRRDGE